MKKWAAAVYRYARAITIVVAVALAVVLVSVVSVDLGPALKARAERAGGNWLDRGMHIGRLGVQLGRGRFVIEDLVIDGMRPGRGSLARRQAHRGVAHLGRAVPPRGAARQHRDDRLADGGRELPGRPPDLSPRHGSAAPAPHRPVAGRHHAAVRARVARRVRVSRLRLELERGDAQPRRQRRQARSTIAAACASRTAPSRSRTTADDREPGRHLQGA